MISSGQHAVASTTRVSPLLDCCVFSCSIPIFYLIFLIRTAIVRPALHALHIPLPSRTIYFHPGTCYDSMFSIVKQSLTFAYDRPHVIVDISHTFIALLSSHF